MLTTPYRLPSRTLKPRASTREPSPRVCLIKVNELENGAIDRLYRVAPTTKNPFVGQAIGEVVVEEELTGFDED